PIPQTRGPRRRTGSGGEHHGRAVSPIERRHMFIKIPEGVESTIALSPVLVPNGDHMATMNGTIKTLTGKGFGFIATADGQEYFFHQSACADMRFDELREGQAVTFEKGQGPKGPRAENVRRA